METPAQFRHPIGRSWWLLVLLALAIVGRGEKPSDERHHWERIEYPAISVPGSSGNVYLSIDSGSYDGVSHLRFSVHWPTSSGTAGKERREPDIKPGELTVRLHLADGKVVAPLHNGMDRWIGIGNGLGTDWSVLYFFPWSENRLAEAWVELRLPQQTFWVELPYGFARNPDDPLLPDPDRGEPQFPPAMKALPAKDVLVPWLSVDYELGEIQNHWRLMLQVSNPFRPRAEVILYREAKVLWDLHKPTTALEVRWPGGQDKGQCVGIRLTDLLRRSDDYLLGGGAGPDKGRLWGKLVVHVERLPRPKPVDGDF